MVHALCYSLVLLNTDLHVVSTSTRMTRAQFVRNTMATIRTQSDVPTSNADGTRSRSASLGAGGDVSRRSSMEQLPGLPGSAKLQAKPPATRPTRSGSVASWKSGLNASSGGAKTSDSSPDVPFESPSTELSAFVMDPKSVKAWESELESLLKVGSQSPAC